MSWLNNSLNTIKGQLTNLAQEVLADTAGPGDAEYRHGTHDHDEELSTKTALELLTETQLQKEQLDKLCDDKDREIAALRKQINALKVNQTSSDGNAKGKTKADESLQAADDQNVEDSWCWEPMGAEDAEATGKAAGTTAMVDVALGSAAAADVAKLNAMVASLEQQNEELRNSLEELDAQHDQAMQNVLGHKTQLQTQLTELKQLQADRLVEHELAMARLQAQLVEDRERQRSATQAQLELEQRVAEQSQELQRNVLELAEMQQLLDKRGADNGELIERVRQADAEREKLQRELDELAKLAKEKKTSESSNSSSTGKHSEDEFIVVRNADAAGSSSDPDPDTDATTPPSKEKLRDKLVALETRIAELTTLNAKLQDGELERQLAGSVLNEQLSELETRLRISESEKEQLQLELQRKLQQLMLQNQELKLNAEADQETHANDLEQQLGALRSENSQLRQELDASIAQAKFRQAIAEEKQEITDLDLDLDEVSTTDNDPHKLRSLLEALLADNTDQALERTHRLLNERWQRLDSTEQRLVDLQDQQLIAEHEKKTLEADISQYILQCDELMKNNELLLNELDKFKRNKLETIEEHHEETIAQLEAQLEETQSQLQHEQLQRREQLRVNEQQLAELRNQTEQQEQLVEVRELQAQLKEKQEQLTELRSQAEQQEQQLEQLDEVKQLQAQLENKEQQLADLKAQSAQLEARLQTQLSQQADELKVKEQQLVELHIQLQHGLEEHSQLTQLSEQLLQLQALKQSHEEQLQTKAQQQRQQAEELEELEKQLLESRQSVAELEQQQQLVNEQLLELRTELRVKEQALQESKQQREQALQESKQQREQLEAQLEQLKSQHSANEQNEQLEQLAQQLQQTKAQLEEKEQQLQALQTLEVEQQQLTAQQTEQLKLQVEELKTQLQQQAKEAGDHSTQLAVELEPLKAQLETLNQEKLELIKALQQKHAENTQYYAEIQRLQPLEQQLSELLKEREKLCDQINFLKEKSDILTANLLTEQRQLQQQQTESQEQQSTVQRDLERLRAHLLEVEELHTQESVELQRELEESRAKQAALQHEVSKSSTAYTSASIRANQQAETLQAQHALLLQQRDELLAKLGLLEDRELKQQAALTNLQCALEQFQNDKAHDIEMATQRMRREQQSQLEKQTTLQNEMAALQQQLTEANQGLRAAARLSDQLEAGQQTIAVLRDEVDSLKNANLKLEQNLSSSESSQTDKIDKSLIKSLLIGYVVSGHAGDKQQVLRMISSVLDFNAQEADKVGLNKPQSSWLGSILGGSSGGASAAGTGNDNLLQAFVQFLEQESQPQPSAQSRPPLLSMAKQLEAAPVAATGTTVVAAAVPTAATGAAGAVTTTTASSEQQAVNVASGTPPTPPMQTLLMSSNEFVPTRNSSSILKDILSDS